MVVAELQSITYNEYLPALLGRQVPSGRCSSASLCPKTGPTVPAVPVEFSTAAFRFGHSQVSDVLWRRGPKYAKVADDDGTVRSSKWLMKQSYFAPWLVSKKDGIDEVLRGSFLQPARCAFSDRNLHSRMPLDPTHVRLKRTCV
jgi:hypothetical protein